MAQQIINTGAAANDGTGDPLRTAFTETNSNFTEIYTAGPVNSNVRITNNTILTLNTNGNLVLAPNGTGRVVANVDVVPNTANVRNLGASTRRWSTVYAQYLDISANTTFGRDLTVGGNLTVTGDIVQVGNIITDAKTIQLANTAGTANAANGSGVTVGANDNIATLLYNSTGNVWTMNIGVSAVGNITGNYIFGNISQANGFPAQYGNSNVTTLLSNLGSNVISGTGNITGGYLIGNGSTLTSVTGANVTGSVANATYATTAGTVTANAQANITSVGTLANLSVTGNITTTANISGSYILGNGSQLTGLPAQYGNSNVTALLSNLGSNTISTTGNVSVGNLILPAGGIIRETSIPFGGLEGNTIALKPSGGTNADQQLLVYPTAGTDFNHLHLTSGNLYNTELFLGNDNLYVKLANTGNVVINSNDDVGNSAQWTFDTDGNLTTSSNLVIGPSGFGTGTAFTQLDAPLLLGSSEANGKMSLVWYENPTGPGNVVQVGLNDSTPGSMTVTTGNFANTTYVWNFDNTGNLTLPTGGNLILSGNIVGSGASPAPSINGFSSINSVTVSASGNVTGAFIKGNGSELTNLPAPAVAQDITSIGDMSIMTYDGNLKYVNNATVEPATGSIKTAGNISATGNITGSYIFGNGSQLTGLPATYGNANVATFLAAYGSNTVVTTGNITGGNLISSATMYGNIDIILGNIANASATRTRLVSNTEFSYIQTGNGTAGSTGNIVFSPYLSSVQRVVINTASGNVSAVGNITAQNFIGNISITGNVQGTSPNVTLVAGSYNWTFDNTGTLTLPAPASGNEGGEIDFGKAGNSTLSGNTVVLDQYVDRIRFFEAGGTTRGAYIDLSQAAAGVGTLLNNRVSGIVNAGVFITMDNLTATVTTSGNRGLSLATVSGTVAGFVSSSYSTVVGAPGGAAGSISLTTTPSTSIQGYNFTSEGDTAIYVVRDNTNNRVYRITMIIGGGYSSNFISFERLL
jgi:hypothetical protein